MSAIQDYQMQDTSSNVKKNKRSRSKSGRPGARRNMSYRYSNGRSNTDKSKSNRVMRSSIIKEPAGVK